MNISRNAVIYGGCEFRSPWNIFIGKGVIGNNCILDGRYGIRIDDDVCLGSDVYIWTAQHNVNDRHFSTDGKTGPVNIKQYAWIASRSTILPNINIGKGAVVASGSVVTKDCEGYGIYAGIPRKKISNRTVDLEYETVNDMYWRFY